MRFEKTRKEAISLVIVIWAAAISSGFAGSIVQGQVSGEINTLQFSQVGQTFTAEDAHISTAGFWIRNATQVDPGGNDFRYVLLGGAGTSGPLLGSFNFTLPDGFEGFADVDFSAATLTVGQEYTILIVAPDYDWAISWSQFADVNGPIAGRVDYTGGAAIVSGEILPISDLTFHIEPVPEPGTCTLLLLVAACFGCARGITPRRFRG